MSVPGVTFVVAVHNGERWLDRVLEAITAQRDDRPFEIIAVDDGSTDGSPVILEAWQRTCGVSVISTMAGSHPGAVNVGLRASSHPLICLVDQDVVLQRGWLAAMTEALDDPAVGAAQGTFITNRHSPVIARVMGLDLEERYSAIAGETTSHVCTGNSAYRKSALQEVGLFDESFGYAADNDMSYRLADAGYRLRLCRPAKAVHHWKESLREYLRQQYGFGYGRLDLVTKHPGRIAGDTVSPAPMMAHAPVMLGAMGAAVAWAVAAVRGVSIAPAGWLALALVGALGTERLAAGVRAAVRYRDPAGLCFPLFHLLRDVAWAHAMLVWTLRRMAGRKRRPGDSMAHGRAKPRKQV